MKSFQHAFRGLLTILATQRNARVHFCISLIVVVAGFWLGVTAQDWCLLILCMGLVISAEALNTGIEFVCDAVHPEQHPLIGKAKDVAAAGVLVAAMAAAGVGALIFWPRWPL